MRKYKVALVLMVLVLVAALGAKQYSTITMGDNEWIGLASDAGRILFDDRTTDEIQFHDASVGINEADPKDYWANELVVSTASGLGGITIRNASDGQGVIAFADGTEGTSRYDGAIRYDHSTQAMEFWTDYDVGPGGVDMTLDGDGNLIVADGRIQTGNAASDIDAVGSMPIAAAEDGQGGYFFYNANVSADTDLTGLYSTESNLERQAWVRWLVYDVTASTTHYGETVLEYSGGLESVVIADEGANDLLFKVARGADPNLLGYACLDVVGNHSYEVVLMTMWH